MRIKDRIVLGSIAFFCLLGIFETIITASGIFELNLQIDKYIETKFIVSGVIGFGIAISKNPKEIISFYFGKKNT